MSSLNHPNPSYLAPLNNADNPDRVPDTYIICLKPGYTITQHESFVGKAFLTDNNHKVMNLYGPDNVGYSGTLTQEGLEKVRSDPGVEFVECDGYIYCPQTFEEDKQDVGEEAMTSEEIAMMEYTAVDERSESHTGRGAQGSGGTGNV